MLTGVEHVAVFSFQRRAAAATSGSRAFRPPSCCLPLISPPLPCGTPRGDGMTATWGSMRSPMSSSRRPTLTRTNSTIRRRLSTTRLPWITSTHPSLPPPPTAGLLSVSRVVLRSLSHMGGVALSLENINRYDVMQSMYQGGKVWMWWFPALDRDGEEGKFYFVAFFSLFLSLSPFFLLSFLPVFPFLSFLPFLSRFFFLLSSFLPFSSLPLFFSLSFLSSFLPLPFPPQHFQVPCFKPAQCEKVSHEFEVKLQIWI